MNYRKSRALSSFDIRHNFVISYNYELPFQRAIRRRSAASDRGLEPERDYPIRLGLSDDHHAKRRPIPDAVPSGVDAPDYIGGLVIPGSEQRRSRRRAESILQQDCVPFRSAGRHRQQQPALFPRARIQQLGFWPS